MLSITLQLLNTSFSTSFHAWIFYRVLFYSGTSSKTAVSQDLDWHWEDKHYHGVRWWWGQAGENILVLHSTQWPRRRDLKINVAVILIHDFCQILQNGLEIVPLSSGGKFYVKVLVWYQPFICILIFNWRVSEPLSWNNQKNFPNYHNSSMTNYRRMSTSGLPRGTSLWYYSSRSGNAMPQTPWDCFWNSQAWGRPACRPCCIWTSHSNVCTLKSYPSTPR